MWSEVTLSSVQLAPYGSPLREMQVALRVTWDGEHTLGALLRDGELVELNGASSSPARHAGERARPSGHASFRREPGARPRTHAGATDRLRSHMSSDEQEIRRLVATWMAATKPVTSRPSSASMAEDVVFPAPGQPPMRGKASFAAAASAVGPRSSPASTGPARSRRSRSWAIGPPCGHGLP